MAFKNYDKENKGEIPSSMLGTVMKNLGHNLKPDQLQEAIEAVDSDGSGWIDFDEFLQYEETVDIAKVYLIDMCHLE